MTEMTIYEETGRKTGRFRLVKLRVKYYCERPALATLWSPRRTRRHILV